MIKQENLELLIDFIKPKYCIGDVYKTYHVLSVEKDLKDSFHLEKPLVFDAFFIHAQRAKSFPGIALKCELLPNDFKTFKLKSTNLLTGEVMDESLRILGRNKIEPEDQYEFWAVWLTNPNDDEFEQDKKVMVVTRPLELESENKNDSDIKLNF